MRNDSVKLFQIWTSGSGGDVIDRYFFFGALAALLFSRGNHKCNFGKGYYEEQFSGIFEFRPVVMEEMLFEDISYLELCQPFCSEEQNHLCNFSRES